MVGWFSFEEHMQNEIVIKAYSQTIELAEKLMNQLKIMSDALDISRKALKYADSVLFDTYSNAQKLTWQEIEENCRSGCEETNKALDKLIEMDI